jgi:hypothetical protein
MGEGGPVVAWWRTTAHAIGVLPSLSREDERGWGKRKEATRTGTGHRCWAGARLPSWADSGQRRRDGGWAARAGRERKRVGPERERAQGDRIGFYKKE